MAEIMTERQAWKRLPDETVKAFRAFTDYRLMGADRSLAKLQEEYKRQSSGNGGAKKPPTKTLRTLEKWSSLYQWQGRIRAWEDEQAAEAERKFAEERERFLLSLRETSVKLLERAANMLQWPLQETTVTEYYDDGRPKAIKVAPADWSLRDAERFARAAKEVGQMVYEITNPTQPVEHSGRIDAGQKVDLSGLSDEQLERLAERLGN